MDDIEQALMVFSISACSVVEKKPALPSKNRTATLCGGAVAMSIRGSLHLFAEGTLAAIYQAGGQLIVLQQTVVLERIVTNVL